MHSMYQKKVSRTLYQNTLSSDKRRGKVVLVIGISEYDKLASLSFCKNDGDKMYELLKSLDYEITDNNKLTGTVKWAEMREAIIKFFTQNVKI